jgi:hypothetical protein
VNKLLTQSQRSIYRALLDHAEKALSLDGTQTVFTVRLRELRERVGYKGGENATRFKAAVIALAKINARSTVPAGGGALVSCAFPLLSEVAVDDGTGLLEYSLPPKIRALSLSGEAQI